MDYGIWWQVTLGTGLLLLATGRDACRRSSDGIATLEPFCNTTSVTLSA